MNKESSWYKRMVEKYGSEEAISEVMRQNANKSKRNTGGVFNAKSEEAAQEARSKGGFVRAQRIKTSKQTTFESKDPTPEQETNSQEA